MCAPVAQLWGFVLGCNNYIQKIVIFNFKDFKFILENCIYFEYLKKVFLEYIMKKRLKIIKQI
jgi:hypothetical protein